MSEVENVGLFERMSDAVKSQDIELVKSLIKLEEPEIAIRTFDRLLELSIRLKNEEITSEFLKLGISLGGNEIALAVKNRSSDSMIDLLIEYSDAKNSLGVNAAIKTKDHKNLNKLLDAGFELDSESLKFAVEVEDIDVIKQLRSLGRFADAIDLFIAVKLGNESIVSELFADIEGNSKISKMSCCLRMAVESKNKSMYDLLISLGLNPNQETLNAAIWNNDKPLVSELVAGKIVLGERSMQKAILTKDKDMISFLLELGKKVSDHDMSLASSTKDEGVISTISSSYIPTKKLEELEVDL